MTDLFSSDSPVVSATLLLLILLSVVTWSIALFKLRRQLQDRKHNGEFLTSFWAARDWNAAAQMAAMGEGDVARLAQAGFDELKALDTERQDLMHTGAPQEVLERQLRQQVQNIQRYHERGLAELATIGSTAPFVGLFGTVWGIMHALQNIGQTGSASLDVVAISWAYRRSAVTLRAAASRFNGTRASSFGIAARAKRPAIERTRILSTRLKPFSPWANLKG